jgi:hypothetical protein
LYDDTMLKHGWRERAGWLLAAALLAVLVFGYLMRVTAYFSAVPGDLGDPRFNSVVLEHLYRFLTGSAAALWSPDFFYPSPGVLGFSDTHLGSALPYVIARLAGLPREHAFDVWFITGTLLNFASMLYVLRRLGASTAAAALGAFFFSCALPVAAQDSHAQLVYRFAAPLAVLAHWQMFERRRLADFARVAFFTAWQFYCSVYLGVFLVYLLAALTVAIFVVRRPAERQPWRAGWAALAVVLLSALALAWLLGSHFVVSLTYNLESQRSIAYIGEQLPRPWNYLIPDEQQMFIGFGAMVLMVAAFAWRSREAVPGLTKVMLIALGLLIAGTLWIADFSLYYLVAWLPGIKGIRVVARIIFIMLIPISVLVALGADAVGRRFGRSAWTTLPALAILVALVALEPLTRELRATPIANWQARLHAVRALLPPDLPRDAILLVRTNSRKTLELIYTELDAMLLGQDLGYAVFNGYSAFGPPGYQIRPCPRPEERSKGADYGRRVVVLDIGQCQ